jgi:polyhydroxyalkanoate synthase
VDIPACFVSAVEDHIAPWKSTFLGAQALSSDVHFILGKAGHVAGIINPPGPKAYDHFTGPSIHGQAPEEWFAKAKPQSGSWWEAWDKWVAQYAGGEVPARHPGDGRLTPLGDAPGTYVRIRAADQA